MRNQFFLRWDALTRLLSLQQNFLSIKTSSLIQSFYRQTRMNIRCVYTVNNQLHLFTKP